MQRPFPWKCGTCGEPRVQPKTVDYATTIEHDGRIHELRLPALELLECAACGARMLPDEASSRITDALRGHAGLLSPAQIRQGRETCHWTQETLAGTLHVPAATVARWESGAQLQTHAVDLLLRSCFDVPELRHYLESGQPNGVPRQEAALPVRAE